MINALKKNDCKFLLIGKINGLANESKRARILYRGAKEKGWKFAHRKNLVGFEARHYLLAYGFLRGIPYKKMELNCREDNEPNPKSIFKIVQLHAPSYIMYDPYTKTGGKTYTVVEEDVVKWLAGEEA